MKYRAALIGCGKIGSEFAGDPGAAAAGVYTHAEAYARHGETELVAVCDTDPEKVERCGRRWHVAGRYRDPLRLLAEQRPDIVSICTPDPTHHELARAALNGDGVRAVLAEKPLALELGQAEELTRLARRRGVVLAVNYSRRYADSHVRLRGFLRAGGVGTVRLVSGLYTKGTLHNGAHWFDLARFLVGEVVRVEAADRLREGGADPSLDVRLDFAGGAVARLHACPAADFTVFEMDVVGARGRVRLVEAGNVLEFFEAVEGVPFAGYRGLVLKERAENGLRDVLLHAVRDVVACVQTGAAPRCSGQDAVRALRIALAAREAAAGGPVGLKPDAD
jgi:predicted dehydrogenase